MGRVLKHIFCGLRDKQWGRVCGYVCVFIVLSPKFQFLFFWKNTSPLPPYCGPPLTLWLNDNHFFTHCPPNQEDFFHFYQQKKRRFLSYLGSDGLPLDHHSLLLHLHTHYTHIPHTHTHTHIVYEFVACILVMADHMCVYVMCDGQGKGNISHSSNTQLVRRLMLIIMVITTINSTLHRFLLKNEKRKIKEGKKR